MNKISTIIVLIFFYSSLLFADEPEYSNSLNENRIKYGWKIISSTSLGSTERSATEIITLTKNKWLLKCSFHYFYDEFYQRCYLP